jgi:hypothetical protein
LGPEIGDSLRHPLNDFFIMLCAQRLIDQVTDDAAETLSPLDGNPIDRAQLILTPSD